MPSKIVAYGFLGRYRGDVQRESYRMPASVTSPLSDFHLYSVLCWPDPFSEEELLLSLKVQIRHGQWKEQLLGPEPLRRYRPPFDWEAAQACAPRAMLAYPGRFFRFVGEEPIGALSLRNPVVEVERDLEGTPRGPVAVRWGGALRGLLLIGTRP